MPDNKTAISIERYNKIDIRASVRHKGTSKNLHEPSAPSTEVLNWRGVRESDGETCEVLRGANKKNTAIDISKINPENLDRVEQPKGRKEKILERDDNKPSSKITTKDAKFSERDLARLEESKLNIECMEAYIQENMKNIFPEISEKRLISASAQITQAIQKIDEIKSLKWLRDDIHKITPKAKELYGEITKCGRSARDFFWDNYANEINDNLINTANIKKIDSALYAGLRNQFNFENKYGKSDDDKISKWLGIHSKRDSMEMREEYLIKAFSVTGLSTLRSYITNTMQRVRSTDFQK